MEKTQKEKPVGIWIRVSTEDQARGESPEHHEKRASYYAESKGWNIKEVYHLEAVSGKSVMEHPETQRMLKDIKSGHITGLIFSKLARLARNTRELLEFSDIFREYEADLISLQESIDTSTPAGRLFYTVIAAMAQWEREEIASRVAASVPIRAKLGKSLGGQAPFGYMWKDKKLIPDTKEAPVAGLIYEYFLEHHRKKTVARLLNEAGYRTRKGSKFSDTTVHRLLKDPTAKGLHRLNYTKSLGDNKKWVEKPKEDWVILKVEPIISEELWNQCNAILEEHERKNKRPSRKAVHLFTSHVFCHCGGKMAAPSNSPKYICQKCRNKIPMQDLEEIYQEQLKNFFFSPKDIANYLSQADQVIKEKETLMTSLEKQKQSLLLEKEKVYRAYINDVISMQEYGVQFRPITQRLEQMEKEIPDIQGEIDFLKIQLLSSGEILNEAKDLYSRWKDLIFEEKRKIVENITDNIIIGKDDISINLCYLPSSLEMMAEKQRHHIAALPFCHIQLQVKRRVHPAYPTALNTLGDHIRARRLDLGLFQRQVAKRLGVTALTITGWEKNKTAPIIAQIPKIIEFLGYVPYGNNFSSFKDKLQYFRKLSGLSQAKLAQVLELDESNIAKWERGEHEPSRKMMNKMSMFFKKYDEHYGRY